MNTLRGDLLQRAKDLLLVGGEFPEDEDGVERCRFCGHGPNFGHAESCALAIWLADFDAGPEGDTQ